MDWSALVDEISFAGVGPAVLAAAAAVIALLLIVHGARIIIGMVRGGSSGHRINIGGGVHLSEEAQRRLFLEQDEQKSAFRAGNASHKDY